MGLEAEALVELDGSLVIDVDVEGDFGTSSAAGMLDGFPDQFPGEARSPVSLADEEVVYLEARSVVDAQNETMSDIDTKAVQTVRFDVLLVGVLLTAAQITGTSTVAGADVFNPALLFVAVLSLLASVVLGVVTYNESDLYVGLDGRYVEALVREDIGDERWDRHVVRTFAGMIAENGEEIAWNSWLLTLTQSALVVGVLTGVASVVI